MQQRMTHSCPTYGDEIITLVSILSYTEPTLRLMGLSSAAGGHWQSKGAAMARDARRDSLDARVYTTQLYTVNKTSNG